MSLNEQLKQSMESLKEENQTISELLKTKKELAKASQNVDQGFVSLIESHNTVIQQTDKLLYEVHHYSEASFAKLVESIEELKIENQSLVASLQQKAEEQTNSIIERYTNHFHQKCNDILENCIQQIKVTTEETKSRIEAHVNQIERHTETSLRNSDALQYFAIPEGKIRLLVFFLFNMSVSIILFLMMTRYLSTHDWLGFMGAFAFKLILPYTLFVIFAMRCFFADWIGQYGFFPWLMDVIGLLSWFILFYLNL